MSSDDSNGIRNQLRDLRVTQSNELVSLLVQHQQEQDNLLISSSSPSTNLRGQDSSQVSETSPPLSSSRSSISQHWSHNNLPLFVGSKVIIRNTAKVGAEGDLAIVRSLSSTCQFVSLHLLPSKHITQRIAENLDRVP